MSVQISAYVSDSTKASIEAYSVTHGIKKGYLIENAIEHYLQALRELPEDFIVPVKLELTPESFEKASSMVFDPAEPTEVLRELMGED